MRAIRTAAVTMALVLAFMLGMGAGSSMSGDPSSCQPSTTVVGG